MGIASDLKLAIVPVLAGAAAGLGLAALVGGRPGLVAGLILGCAVSSVICLRREANEPLRSSAGPDEVAGPVLTADIFEHLPDALMLLDSGGRILFVNSAMRAIVGGETERRHVSSLFRNPVLLEAIAKHQPVSTEYVMPVPVERHFMAYVADTGGASPLTILALHDMTAIRRTERMRADFVANASHELRTPLAAVSGFIDTLKGHAKDDPEAREQFLDIMATEAGRMRRLIDDLLSLTRIELNEHVPPTGQVTVGDVVREAAAALGPLAAADGMRIDIHDEGPAQVTGERDELVQLFQNLIHNAIKYGRENTSVTVTLKRSGDQVAVSIRDEGEGIPQEAIPRLTERFYRVDVKRSREKGGTGLGLAIVKHIVSRHRGSLKIESNPGKGSVFTVILPVLESAVTEV